MRSLIRFLLPNLGAVILNANNHLILNFEIKKYNIADNIQNNKY